MSYVYKEVVIPALIIHWKNDGIIGTGTNNANWRLLSENLISGYIQ